MALAKLRGAVWWTGTAVWWMAARSDSRLVDFTGLYQYPDLIAAWTHAIVVFELAFALLVWNRLARPLMLGLSIVMWTCMALLTGLVPFCLLMMAGNLAFISAPALRLFLRRAPANQAQPQQSQSPRQPIANRSGRSDATQATTNRA
jgi:hypothetical protein